VRSKGEFPRRLWWLAAAFVVVAGAFMAGTMITEREASSIDAEVASLDTNALPSVTHLMAVRTALRRLDTSTAEAAADPSTAMLDRVRSSRSDLDAELEAYLALPAYGGERELFRSSVPPNLVQLDEAINRLEGAGVGSRALADRESAHAAITHALDLLDHGVSALIELNTLEGTKATEHILSVRQASIRLAMTLDAAAAVVAVGAAAIAMAGATRYASQRELDAAKMREHIDDLNTFAQRLSHDVLSPLSAVGLSLAALGRQHGDETTRRVLARAQRSLVRSRDLAVSTYEFARSDAVPQPGKRAPLRATIDAAVEGLLEVSMEAPADISVAPFEDCDVACDPGVLLSMLSNVLSNAMKFSREPHTPKIWVRASSTDGRVRVEVEDAGPGIPEGLERAIFEPYVRAPGVAQPGLGLGLATVKRYALAHGGSVGARRMEHGSLVWFELPRAPERPSAVPRTPPPPAAREPPTLH
jgi:signal transduction histidine kinase